MPASKLRALGRIGMGLFNKVLRGGGWVDVSVRIHTINTMYTHKSDHHNANTHIYTVQQVFLSFPTRFWPRDTDILGFLPPTSPSSSAGACLFLHTYCSAHHLTAFPVNFQIPQPQPPQTSTHINQTHPPPTPWPRTPRSTSTSAPPLARAATTMRRRARASRSSTPSSRCLRGRRPR